MNFVDYFIKRIKMLYFTIKCCVKNNNWVHATECYEISRGIRQRLIIWDQGFEITLI